MDLREQLCLSVSPLCKAKNFNVGHYTQTFEPDSVILTILIGTTDLCHILPQVVLSLRVKVSREQNLLASFSLTLLN